MKTVIIIGASSGLGRELAKQYINKGYRLGILARRIDALEEIASFAPDRVVVGNLDISSDYETVFDSYNKFLNAFEHIDLIIHVAGIGSVNHELELNKELTTNDVNVHGFTTITIASIQYFLKQRSGHYAAVTSIVALSGRADCPAYNASKAYQSNYIEAMRQYVYRQKADVVVSDIQPGFIDTGKAKGDKFFWMASTQKAAKQIIYALEKRREHVYITRRWRLIAWIIKITPRFLRKRYN